MSVDHESTLTTALREALAALKLAAYKGPYGLFWDEVASIQKAREKLSQALIEELAKLPSTIGSEDL